MLNFFKRVWSNARDSWAVGSSIGFNQRFQVGSANFYVPQGWQPDNESEGALSVSSLDRQQRATISITRFESELSFDSFKELCDKRLYLERQELQAGFVEPSPPVTDKGIFKMFFSGWDKDTGRLFSGYLSALRTELITIYVEGLGISASHHLDSFEVLVGGLER